MRYSSYLLLAILSASVLLTGCATMQQRLNSYRQQNKGIEKTFDFTKQATFEAAKKACAQVGLRISKENSDYIYAKADTTSAAVQGAVQGVVAAAIPILGLAMSACDLAPATEQVAIYLTEIEAQKTKVEIVQDPRSIKKGKDCRLTLLNRIETNLE